MPGVPDPSAVDCHHPQEQREGNRPHQVKDADDYHTEGLPDQPTGPKGHAHEQAFSNVSVHKSGGRTPVASGQTASQNTKEVVQDGEEFQSGHAQVGPNRQSGEAARGDNATNEDHVGDDPGPAGRLALSNQILDALHSHWHLLHAATTLRRGMVPL